MSARNSITIATAGHVDHGKTSLVNKITGIDTDTLAEEKSRGLSINLGFAYLHITEDDIGKPVDYTIGFIDVPGHTDFINNALAGISVVDSALLVIAADDGVMPQTREHLAILDLLGIKNGAIALTKIDKSSPEQIDKITGEIVELLSDSCLKHTRIFPVSSISGSGVAELVNFLKQPLFSGPIKPVIEDKNFRFIIDRSFTVKGIGTVVTGTIKSGTVSVGGSLVHSSTGNTVRVKALRHDQQQITDASPGERVSMNINIPQQQIHRGDWLLDSLLNHPVKRLDVKLRLLQPIVFKSSTQYHLYHGASHRLVNIRPLPKENPVYYQMSLAEPIFALHGDRFVLRDPASTRTIGGGEIIDILIPRRGRSNPERIEILKALDQEDYTALKSLLESQDCGLDMDSFSLSRNCNSDKIALLFKQLEEENISFVRLKLGNKSLPFLLHSNFYQQFCDTIFHCLENYHQTNSNQLGMSEPALSKSVSFKNSHLLFHGILDKLIAEDSIKRTGTLLHLPDHTVKLSPEEHTFMDKIRPVLQKAGYLPPRTRELTEITGMDLRTLERTLAQARKAGSLVQVAPNRHYLPETIMQLAEFTETLAQRADEGFSVIQFRDEIGIGRNLCIEILEYFDKVGFTRRDGNNRFVRTPKENLFGNTLD